jgi:hypothetical protein
LFLEEDLMKNKKLLYGIICAALLLGLAWSNAPALKPVAAPATQGDLLEKLVSNADTLTIRVNLPELFLDEAEALDGNMYTVAWAQGAGMGEEGKPGIPIFRTWILVPNGKTAAIQVDPGGPQIINDVYLKPEQPPVADLENAPIHAFTIDQKVYATDADYPGFLASLGDYQMLRGQHIAMLQLFPYQFNPVKRTLKAYDQMQVTVTFDGALASIPPALRSGTFEAVYHKLAINAPEVLAAEDEVARPKIGTTPYGFDYLILTKSSLAQAANTLAAWKNKQGFKAAVAVIPATWKAKDIRTATRGAYMNWGTPPEYILLLGDAEIIPPFYISEHPFNSEPYNGKTYSQGYVGTDLYYGTLDDEDPDPTSDVSPDVYVGRLSVDKASDAMYRVNAIIAYEQNPTLESSFYNTAVFASYFQDGGSVDVVSGGKVVDTITIPSDGVEDKRYIQTSEDLAQFLAASPQSKTVKRIYYTESTVNPLKYNDNKQKGQDFTNFSGPSTTVGASLPASLKRPTFAWNGNFNDVVNAINAGAFLVAHRDHGGRLNWAAPYFNTINAGFLDNPSRTPVVWSINCMTGWFDNETDFPGAAASANWTSTTAESLSEAFERPIYGWDGSYGAVGIVASTRVTYGSYNEHLYLAMANLIWPGTWSSSKGGVYTNEAIYEMGSLINISKSYMYTYVGRTQTGLVQLEALHWFGDPSMEIRTKMPVLMMVVFPAEWSKLLIDDTLVVIVNWPGSGEQPAAPVVGAKVSIFKEGEVRDQWTAKTNAEGRAVFPGFKAFRPGEHQVVVTAPNARPFQGAFQVTPGSQGGVWIGRPLYTCGQRLALTGADANLEGSGKLNVLVETSAGDAEDVELGETSTPGYFKGGIDSASGAPNLRDGIIQVTDGLTLTITYQDANDGSDNPATAVDTARVDCQPPSFEGLKSLTQGACSASLSWQPAFDPSLPVQYNVYRSQVSKALDLSAPALIGNTFATSFNDYLCWPGKSYEYMVRAQDQAGLEDGNIVTKSVMYYGFFLPIIMR